MILSAEAYRGALPLLTARVCWSMILSAEADRVRSASARSSRVFEAAGARFFLQKLIECARPVLLQPDEPCP